MTSPVLKGDGILLRPWSLDDADGVLRLADDEASRRWSLSLRTVSTFAEAEAFIRVRQARGANWAVVDPSTDELLGRVGLVHLDEDDNCAEVGYGVMAAFRRQGVARRAVETALAYGFGELGLARICLEHGMGNAASCAVARACGFAFEGIMRSAHRRGDGEYDDAHLHARLATDPPPDPEQLRHLQPVEIAAGAYQLCIPDADLDASSILAACADPLIQLFNAGPTTLEDARTWCAERSDWSSGEHASWLVKDTAGTLLGAVSLFQIDRKALGCQAGYWVAAPARGRGVASSALVAAARFAFGGLGLGRVELFHAIENEASCRVALRAGFAFEGAHRQSYRYGDGILRDEHSHARLASDPPSGPGERTLSRPLTRTRDSCAPGARSPRLRHSTPERPSHWAMLSSSAASSSAVSAGAPGSACAAWTRRTPACRSDLRSTLATSLSPRRNGRT
jgi:RimJ/RimL family protein N-acetyltransferase